METRIHSERSFAHRRHCESIRSHPMTGNSDGRVGETVPVKDHGRQPGYLLGLSAHGSRLSCQVILKAKIRPFLVARIESRGETTVGRSGPPLWEALLASPLA